MANPDGSDTPSTGFVPRRNMRALYSSFPSWNVSGVDYGVGINANKMASMTDWTTLGAGQNVSQVGTGLGGTQYVRAAGGAIVLDGVDFTLHGGGGIYAASGDGCTGITVTNCKFGASTPNIICSAGSSYVFTNDSTVPIVFEYNTIDINGTAMNLTNSGFQVIDSPGSVTAQYNWLRGSGPDIMVTSGQFMSAGVSVANNAVIDIRFNLFDNMSMNNAWAAHQNYCQWFTIGTGVSFTFDYNALYQSSKLGAEAVQFYPNISGSIATATCRNNTFMCVTPSGGGTCMTYPMHGGTVVTGTVNDNYVDLTGISGGAFYPNASSPGQGMIVGNGWTIGGSGKAGINMNTGATLTPA